MTDPHIFAMVCEQRDRAMSELAASQRENASLRESLDALARAAQDASDRRHKRLAEERLAIMADCAAHLGSATFGHGAERDAFLRLFAHVAEYGKNEKLEAMRAAYAEWEARR